MAVLNIVCSAGIKNDKLVHDVVNARDGNVIGNSGRRPYVSIVKNAGSAKTQLRIPVPIEMSKAVV